MEAADFTEEGAGKLVFTLDTYHRGAELQILATRWRGLQDSLPAANLSGASGGQALRRPMQAFLLRSRRRLSPENVLGNHLLQFNLPSVKTEAEYLLGRLRTTYA